MNRLKKALAAVLSLLLFLSIISYFFPISTPKEEKVNLPFPNSLRSNIEGVDLHYRVWRPKRQVKGKILMVHGFGGSTFSWNKTAEALADENYLVVAVDLPGFGYSERKPGFNHSQDNRSKVAVKLLDKIDTELPPSSSDIKWTLSGHSMGGGTVLAAALNYPKKVKSLVLVSPSISSQNSKALDILIRYPPFSRGLKAFVYMKLIKRKRIESLLVSVYGRKPNKDEIDGYLNPLRQPGTSGTLVDMIETSSSLMPEKLKQIKVPVLVIWSNGDEIVPISEAKQLESAMPHMKISTIDSQSHVPMETDSEKFNRILLNFLSEKIKSETL